MNNDIALVRIAPRPCSFDDCTNIAYWLLDNEFSFCQGHLVSASAMNSDNEEMFFPARVSPVLLPDETTIIVYAATIPAALFSLIDTLNLSRQAQYFEVIYHTNDGQIAGQGVYERFTGMPDGHDVRMLDGLEDGLCMGLAASYNGFVRRLAQHRYEESCYYAEPW